VAQKIGRAAEESPKPSLPDFRSRSAGFPPGGPPPINTSTPSIHRRRWRSCPPDLPAGYTARSHDDPQDQGDRSCTPATAPRTPFLAPPDLDVDPAPLQLRPDSSPG